MVHECSRIVNNRLQRLMSRALQNVTISDILEKDDGLFCSDWRPATSSAESEGAVFSQLISGGNRRPRFIGAMRRGKTCPPSRAAQARRAGLPHGYVAEKTNPGASELRKCPSSFKIRRYAKLSSHGRVQQHSSAPCPRPTRAGA
jgi:hypothetical protein